MQVILILVLIFMFIAVPFCRFVPFQLHKIVYYLPTDIYRHIKYKKKNECPHFGFIKVRCGYFGSGKSLGAVDEVVSIYRRYNGLEVWSEDLQAFVKQKITIISNLDLKGVPYIPFISERQFIEYEVGIGEVVLFLVDEIGTVWNNRDFKNFNPEVFQNIVQSRKRKMAIFGTLPDFLGTDINIRRYTHEVVLCKKTWRFLKHSHYNPRDIENCTNIDMVQPLSISYKFITDRMYNQYDTSAFIEKLGQEMLDGKFVTTDEMNVEQYRDLKQSKLRRKYQKRQKS